jgi:predicted SAM-dependent methyltransferase
MATWLVFAPGALIRFKNGRAVVHNTSSPLPAFESDSPMLIGWLCQFSKPFDVEQALLSLQESDRKQVIPVLEYLRKSSVLVSTEAADRQASSGTEQIQESKHYLRLLARSIYEISCDLNALDPSADERLRGRSGLGVRDRLMSLIAAIDGLRAELLELNRQQIAEQQKELGVTSASRDLKLHIGCGKGHLPGWINIDVHPAPLALNVLRGLPFSPASASHVFVSHFFEHLYYPGDVKPFLQELRRVLIKGGLVRLVVPDIESCIEAYSADDRTFFASRRETWTWWPENSTRLEDFLAYAGAGPDPAYLFEAHKYGYDFETLSRVLRDAGFEAIVKSAYMDSVHNELRVDDASAVAKAKYGERYYSLFVEARST